MLQNQDDLAIIRDAFGNLVPACGTILRAERGDGRRLRRALSILRTKTGGGRQIAGRSRSYRTVPAARNHVGASTRATCFAIRRTAPPKRKQT
jgi:hypothetical protein